MRHLMCPVFESMVRNRSLQITWTFLPYLVKLYVNA